MTLALRCRLSHQEESISSVARGQLSGGIVDRFVRLVCFVYSTRGSQRSQIAYEAGSRQGRSVGMSTSTMQSLHDAEDGED